MGKVGLTFSFLILSYQNWIDDWNNACGWEIFHGLFTLLASSLVFFWLWWPPLGLTSQMTGGNAAIGILIFSRLCSCIVYLIMMIGLLLIVPLLLIMYLWRWHVCPLRIYQLRLRWYLTVQLCLVPEVNLLKLLLISWSSHLLLSSIAPLFNLPILFQSSDEPLFIWLHLLTPCLLYFLESTA